MIPLISAPTESIISPTAEQPSQTYKMDISAECVRGYTDSIEAMKQAVFKILNTERYENAIYSQGYGIELADLFGQPISYVRAELERRIKDALLCDTRIESVDNFKISTAEKGELNAEFEVKTVFGSFTAERSVNI